MTPPYPRRLAALATRCRSTQAFIDGKYVDAADGRTFDCISRSTAVAGAVAQCGAEDVERACGRRGAASTQGRGAGQAGAAQEGAAEVRALIDRHGDELALLESLDMGKRRRRAQRGRRRHRALHGLDREALTRSRRSRRRPAR
jgi:gamma-glutamyl-gamma-aminobutyraldehyde dehydrogenase